MYCIDGYYPYTFYIDNYAVEIMPNKLYHCAVSVIGVPLGKAATLFFPDLKSNAVISQRPQPGIYNSEYQKCPANYTFTL